MPNAMPQGAGSFESLWLLGLCDYEETWGLQQEMNEAVANGRRPDLLLFLEHDHVYTLGRHGNEANLLQSNSGPEREVPVIRTDRGGDITYHGPGQLVVYVIMNLSKRNYGVKELVRRLEEAVIITCAEFGVTGFRREGAPGIWCDTPGGQKKICALGLRVTHGVTMHGLALNVSTDLSRFNLINPCGFTPGSATSIAEITGTTIPLATVGRRLETALINLL